MHNFNSSIKSSSMHWISRINHPFYIMLGIIDVLLNRRRYQYVFPRRAQGLTTTECRVFSVLCNVYIQSYSTQCGGGRLLVLPCAGLCAVCQCLLCDVWCVSVPVVLCVMCLGACRMMCDVSHCLSCFVGCVSVPVVFCVLCLSACRVMCDFS